MQNDQNVNHTSPSSSAPRDPIVTIDDIRAVFGEIDVRDDNPLGSFPVLNQAIESLSAVLEVELLVNGVSSAVAQRASTRATFIAAFGALAMRRGIWNFVMSQGAQR